MLLDHLKLVSSSVVTFRKAGLDSVASKVTDLLRFGCFFWCDTFLAFSSAFFLTISSFSFFFCTLSCFFFYFSSFSFFFFSSFSLNIAWPSALVNTQGPVTLVFAVFFLASGRATYCTRYFEIALVEDTPDDLGCELLTTVSQRWEEMPAVE